MDIKEIRAEKGKMENNMQRIISQMVGLFVDNTGVKIESVVVRMIDVTSLGDEKPKYVVGDVNVELERI